MKAVIKSTVITLAMSVSSLAFSANTINTYKENQFLPDNAYSLESLQERIEFAEGSSLMSIPAIVHDAALYQTRDVSGLELADSMTTALDSISASIDLKGRWMCVVTLNMEANTAAYSGSFDYTGGWRATQDGYVACFFQQKYSSSASR